MTWTRFSYICRKALLDIEDGLPIGESLLRAESDTGSELYGKRPAGGSLPRTLLDRLKASSNRENAISALRIYGQLGVAGQLDEPLQFKRIVAYLGLVVFAFHVVGAVYALRVIPAFTEVLGTFEGVQLPARLVYFQEYWMTQTALMSLLLLVCMLSVLEVRRLFRFRDVEKRPSGRLLLGPGINPAYRRVQSVLRFPVELGTGSSRDAVMDQLSRARSAGMDMAIEVRELLHVEMRELVRCCERQLKVMSCAVALIVLLSVALFLVSAYAPVFILGEVI